MARSACWWEGAQLGVLLLYGLAMSGCRDVVYTKQASVEAEFGLGGEDLSRALSWGYAAYALGKLTLGRVVDVAGGRAAWVVSLGGAAVATAAFAALPSDAGFGGFAAVWVVSRLLQPAAFIGAIRLSSKWFSYCVLGRNLGWLNATTYVFDALVRLGISGLTSLGLNLRMTFISCGGVAFAVALLGLGLLRDGPASVGLPPPPRNPHALDPDSQRLTLGGGLSLLLRSVDFWIVLLLGVTLGTTREIFLCFLEPLLRNAGAGDSLAIALSGAFPLLGVPGAVACGWLVDAFGRRRNGAICFAAAACLLGLAAALWAVEARAAGPPPLLAVAGLSSAIGVVVIGPYSLMAGVFAADLGGPAAAGMASGLVDFASYSGAIVFTALKSRLSGDGQVLLCVLALAGANFAASVAMLCCDGRRRESAAAGAAAAHGGAHGGVLDDEARPLLAPVTEAARQSPALRVQVGDDG